MSESDHDLMLVVPPVLYPGIPTLGPSLLAPACRELGVSARVHYANLTFAALAGFEVCSRLASAKNLIGEALFLHEAFPAHGSDKYELMRELFNDSEADAKLRQSVSLQPISEDELPLCFGAAKETVKRTAEYLVSQSPKIVGFSTMVQQTLASLAIARKLKEIDPSILVVMGGANAAEPIASAILAQASWIDLVFSGEVDKEFPEFCAKYLQSGCKPERGVVTGRGVPILDAVPSPDYDDYFRELTPLKQNDPTADKAPHFLIFESSRGCWWGDKLNCTFCGYNFPGTNYRAKSPERVISEIQSLVDKYGVERFYASDNIMAPKLPSMVLGKLAERGVNVALSYEVKTPIPQQDLDNFVLAGIFEIQPGIESFSTHILKLMKKGVTGLDNLRVIRDSHSRGLKTVWNILTGIPGETKKDYEELLRLIPLISHLPPPTRWGPIRISRYSPYHNEPENYGIDGLRPWKGYYRLFGEYADDMAMHFFGNYSTEFFDSPQLIFQLDEAINKWKSEWKSKIPPILHIRHMKNGGAVIKDTRDIGNPKEFEISEKSTSIINALSFPKKQRSIDFENISAIEDLVEKRLVAFHESRYLSLIVEPEIGAELREKRFQKLVTSKVTAALSDPVNGVSELGAGHESLRTV